MNKQVKEIIYQDYGFTSWIEYFKKCYFYPEVRIGCLYRKAQFYTKSKNILVRFFWKYKWLNCRKRTGYQISLAADIGVGFRLLHNGVRMVVSGSKIGKNCMIGVNVVIGNSYSYSDKRFGSPTIGERVYIGHNSSIVGEITIGNDVLIAPNAFVNQDVPDHSIVIGNNIIISKQNPSAQYLKWLV